MRSELRIPLAARLQPMLFVLVPDETVSLEAPRLESVRGRRFHDVPPGLSALVERHPAELEVRIYDPGTKVDGWLGAHVANRRGRQRLIGVHTDDLNTHPRTGLWAVMLTAMMLARELGGEVYDPDAMRTVALHPPAGFLTVDGRIAVGNHITIPYSHGPKGKIWMTTKGMRKFGLPELEIRDLPPGSRWFWFVLNGVAQKLVDHAFETVDGDPASGELRLPPTLTVDTSLLFRAYGMPGHGGGSRNRADLRLSFERGRTPDGLVRVLPPRPGEPLGPWVESIGESLIRLPGAPSPN